MWNRILVIGLIVVATSGCAWMEFGAGAERRSGSSTSLVDYLYPDGEIPPAVTASVPTLELPLRVGVAFVPTRQRRGIALTETDKMRLLDDVRQQFSDLDYVEQIETIPGQYLRPQQGLDGMRQVARLFNVDVMALVSYDQVAKTYDNTQSLLYWTIVGAYVFEGTDHDTRTFVDLAVIDVQTGKLLLRAPGFNERRGDTTLVDAEDALERNSRRGFNAAMAGLNQNLAAELAIFEERLKSQPDDIKVAWRGGGGAASALGLVALFGLVLVRRRCW